MKKLLLLPVFAFLHVGLKAQCSLQDTITSNVTCYNACNGSAMAIATGSGPFSYLWSPGGQTTASVSGLCNGTYTTVMQDANGCVATATVVITQPTQVTVTVTPVSATCSTCADGSASTNVAGGNPPYTYNWIPQGSSGPTISGQNPGTYSLTVTDASGCPVGTLYTIGNSVGITEQTAITTFAVFPNPTTDLIQLPAMKEEIVSLSITDLVGEAVSDSKVLNYNNTSNTLDVSLLKSGMYLLSITTKKGIMVARFIRE